MKGLGLVDLEASRPGAVGGVHETDTKQLVVVVAGPVEDHAGAWQGGDVALGVGCTLGHVNSLVTSNMLYSFTVPLGQQKADRCETVLCVQCSPLGYQNSSHLSSCKLSLSKGQLVCGAVVQQVAWGEGHYVSVPVAPFSFPHTDTCGDQTGINDADSFTDITYNAHRVISPSI